MTVVVTRDLEIWVRGHSRSFKLVLFESSGAVSDSLSPSMVTMAQSCISFARYSDLMVENRKIFILHLHLAAPQRVNL